MSKFNETLDPDFYLDPHRQNKQPVGSGLNTNNWAIIRDKYALQPIYGGLGRVLVKVDEYQSSRDCTVCHGTGHTGNPCPECHGNGRYRGKKTSEENCTTCYILRDKSQAGSKGAWINLNGKEDRKSTRLNSSHSQ